MISCNILLGIVIIIIIALKETTKLWLFWIFFFFSTTYLIMKIQKKKNKQTLPYLCFNSVGLVEWWIELEQLRQQRRGNRINSTQRLYGNVYNEITRLLL